MDDIDRLRPIIDAAAKEAAKEASEETLRDVFKLFGVDLTNVAAINRFRADLIFARKQREISERARSIAFRTVIAAVVAGVFSGAAWAGKVIITAVWGGS